MYIYKELLEISKTLSAPKGGCFYPENTCFSNCERKAGYQLTEQRLLLFLSWHVHNNIWSAEAAFLKDAVILTYMSNLMHVFEFNTVYPQQLPSSHPTLKLFHPWKTGRVEVMLHGAHIYIINGLSMQQAQDNQPTKNVLLTYQLIIKINLVIDKSFITHDKHYQVPSKLWTFPAFLVFCESKLDVFGFGMKQAIWSQKLVHLIQAFLKTSDIFFRLN